MEGYLCPYCGEFSGTVQDFSMRFNDLPFDDEQTPEPLYRFQVVCSECKISGPEAISPGQAEDAWQSMCRNLCARGTC